MPSGRTLTADDIELLKRLSARTFFGWVRANRIMPNGQPYSLRQWPFFQPYLREIYQIFSTGGPKLKVVVQKAAQLGWTELAINLAFWFLATKRENVLYMLPSFSQLADFSHVRLEKAILASPDIRRAFSSIDNVGLKLGWGSALYLRGSNSKEKLLEIPVGLLIRDELDRMDPEGAAQAETRLGASRWQWRFDISNPSFPQQGINAEWLEGSQGVWELRCPNGHWHEPVWPDSVKDGRLVCPECGEPVSLAEGRWHHLNPNAPHKSYRLSQLISPTRSLSDIETEWRQAQGDPTRLALFYNFTLGLPYEAGTDVITMAELHRATGDWMQERAGEGYFAGIDPGGPINWIVILDKEGRIKRIAWHPTFEALAEELEEFNIKHAICELRPETRLAKALALRFLGKVSLFEYRPASSELGVKQQVLEGRITLYKMNRTELLDEALARIRKGEKVLPVDAPPEFYQHVTALVRKRSQQRGQDVYVYEEVGPDHLAHAYAFAYLAWKLGSTQHRIVAPTGIERASPWRVGGAE